MTITPAYGRDYKSKAEILKDWNLNLDFLTQPEGRYTNKADCERLGIKSLSVRYKDYRMQAVLKLGPKGWTC